MIWNSFQLALTSIGRNVLRSTLTMLGVIIGVAAVVTMVNLGRGATASITAQIASMGSNLLFVRPGQRAGPGVRMTAEPFELDDAQAIQREIPAVTDVAPSASSKLIAVFGSETWSTTVTGSTAPYFRIRDMAVSSGREFLEADVAGGRSVCIIGETVREELFGGTSPVGERLRVGNFSCEVVGLLVEKGETLRGTDADDIVMIPITTYFRRVSGNTDVQMIQLSARDGVSTSRVKNEIERVFRERRRISSGEEDDFSVGDMQEIASRVTGTTQVMTALLSAVAAVSLIVGGIGIMNIMLVSVTERTREIGIRQAIGAFESDVLLQFLVEASVLSSLGGLLGIFFALLACAVLSSILSMPFYFDPWIALGAFLFSTAVGVVFGYLPARNAAALDPIEALRRE